MDFKPWSNPADQMEVEEGRNPEEEQFRRLAAALGEPLEAVWGMPEQERRHLIQLLLEGSEQPADQGGARPEQPKHSCFDC